MPNTTRSAKGRRFRRRCLSFQVLRSVFITDNYLNRAQSTLTNQSRLKLLHRREEHLQSLFAASREAVLSLASEEGRYSQFLEGLIAQGFLQLMESKIVLQARKKDIEIVTKAAGAAADTYKELSGRTVEFEVEDNIDDDAYVLFLRRSTLRCS